MANSFAGLVASLARPGGNLTGINFFSSELEAKRLALLHELVPKAVRIAVLVNPANVPATESALRDIPDAARAIGLQIQVLKGQSSRDAQLLLAQEENVSYPPGARPGGNSAVGATVS